MHQNKHNAYEQPTDYSAHQKKKSIASSRETNQCVDVQVTIFYMYM